MAENREYISQADENGDIYISEEVLAMIAGAAATEVEGVTGLSGGNFSEQILNKRSLSRGVTVIREEEEITLNISILIRYGCAIPEVAKQVQDAVRTSLQDTSGLKVAAVNVRVGGVTFDKVNS